MNRLAVLLAAVVVATACSAQPAATPAPAKPVVAAVVPPGFVGDVLKGYEGLRKALADDDTAAVAARAKELKVLTDAAVAAAAGAPQVPQTAALAAAANRLAASAETPHFKDFKEARLAYGELSKAVVAVVVADPSLQPGRFLFECPMAKGYQRWVQLEEKMANPYMGKRMLECGMGISPWKVEG